MSSESAKRPQHLPTARYVFSVIYTPTLVTLLLASTLGVMAGATLMPVLEAIRGDLGVSGTAAGLIITAHGLAIAITSPFAGWMIDRWGLRAPLVTGLLVYGIAGGAGMFITSYPLLIASRLIFGIGAALVFSGTSVAILKLYEGSVRDRIMGWRTSATSVGGLIFPLLSGLLATLTTWQAAFSIYLVGIPLGFAALKVIPDIRVRAREKGSDNVIQILKRPALLGVYGFMFVLSIIMYSFIIFVPQRLGQLGVTAPITVAYYMVGMAGAGSMTGLVYARLRRRLPDVVLLRLSAFCWVATFLVLGTAEYPLILAGATVFLGVGSSIAFSTISILIADLVPAAVLGRAIAASSTLMFLGQFASPLLLGPVMTLTSIATGYLVVSAGAAVILMILFLISPVAKRSSLSE